MAKSAKQWQLELDSIRERDPEMALHLHELGGYVEQLGSDLYAGRIQSPQTVVASALAVLHVIGARLRARSES